jgi:hypothetical protein
MTMSDTERIAAIQTREDLVAFLKDFSASYRDDRKSWENDNLESFLSALAAWAEDMEGYYLNQGRPTPKTPEWKTFAEMLMAAKYYE